MLVWPKIPYILYWRHIVLLIVIRPSDGDVKPGGPLHGRLARWAPFILQASLHFTARSPTLPSLYLCRSSFSNPSIASPTSQIILQPFFRFSYITGFHLCHLASRSWSLGAFREEQAMSQHRVSPSPFLSSSSHTTQLRYTNSYTYNHHNLNFLQYTIQILVPHVMWSAQAVRDYKIDHT